LRGDGQEIDIEHSPWSFLAIWTLPGNLNATDDVCSVHTLLNSHKNSLVGIIDDLAEHLGVDALATKQISLMRPSLPRTVAALGTLYQRAESRDVRASRGADCRRAFREGRTTIHLMAVAPLVPRHAVLATHPR
jgi:hypothetical protein